jgi:hypothetical protein
MTHVAIVTAAIIVLGGDPPAGPGALAPNLAPDGDGALLTWIEPADPSDESEAAVMRLRLARFDGRAWGRPVTIAEGGDFFANWADLPSIVRAGDGALVAHWLQRSGPDMYAYDVMLARSTDGGRTWNRLGPAHDDGTRTEHGFVSLVPEGLGARAFWLDGREMGDHGAGNMTLRTAVVGERVGAGAVLDQRVCECCATSAAATAGGPLIAYRDRSPGEVRDIFVSRRVGSRWTPPQRVHEDGWVIAACPVNGPAVDARGPLVALAWFTAATGRPTVRAAFSRDSGASFGPPVTVDDAWPVGRVDMVLGPKEQGVVSWVAKGPDGGAIMLRRITADGGAGPPLKAAAASATRTGGFPRMVAVGTALLLVWTEDAQPTRLRAELISWEAVPAVEAP